MLYSHFRNNFEIKVLKTLPTKTILLNQVSGFVGEFPELKDDALYIYYG